MLIKFILIASVIGMGVWLMRGEQRGNRLALTRLAGTFIATAWIAAVMWPDLLTRIAHEVGVGRGTDLLLYLLVVVFAFAMLYYRKRIRALEERLTTLARAVALSGASSASREDDANA